MKRILGVFVLAVMLAVPGMASAAEKLPDGFIALSESGMTWNDAKAFCEQQGGKLPLVDGSEKREGAVRPGTPIDGFGTAGAPWPTGVPSERVTYWTGSERAEHTAHSVTVVYRDGNVGANMANQTGTSRAICVPK